MLERMRGAGRHEVADESFGFILPAEESSSEAPEPEETSPVQPSPPASAVRSTSNTSAKRRPIDDEATAADPQPSPPEEVQPQPPSSASKANPYDIPHDEAPEDDSGELEGHDEEPTEEHEEEPVAGSSPQLGQAVTSPIAEAEHHDDREVEDASREELPEPMARPASRDSTSRISPAPHVSEEVTESPVDAPGSGHRRRVRMSNVTTQSAELQRMVMVQESGFSAEPGASSPLARKTRMSGVTPSAASARSRRTTRPSALAQSSVTADADELSPIPAQSNQAGNTLSSSAARSHEGSVRRSNLGPVLTERDELSSPVPLIESRRRAQAKKKTKPKRQPSPDLAATQDDADEVSLENAQLDAEDAENAEQIEAEEAARVIGRKRPRASPPREESPELDAERDEPTPPPKRRRQKRTQDSPAVQSKPKAAVGKKPSGEKPKPKKSRKRHSGADEQVPITVQRYTQRRQHNESDTDADILSADIPFSNRSGVNVIDVLAQICEDVIDKNLTILHEAANNTDDSATRKEYRTKLRALEAFGQELGTRLLEHTIALDSLHALKKRIRSIQKEKLTLRNDIIRIRAEKEQVALKIDAVRVRHEKESKRSLVSIVVLVCINDSRAHMISGSTQSFRQHA